MTLIVEDGTGVTSANSYADLSAMRSYARMRGVILSTDDEALEPLVIRAMDYLDTKGLGLLSLSFPLDGGMLCNSVTLDETLTRLSNALGELCIEQHNGVDLAPTRTDAFVIEETVGPITTRYSATNGGGPGTEPDILNVDSLLSPLIAACGYSGIGLFKTLRV